MRLDNMKPAVGMKKLPAKYAIDTARKEELVGIAQSMKLTIEDLQTKVAAYESEYAILISELMQKVMTPEEKRTLAELLNTVSARLRDS